jgi:putative nucleotidyltransferase with HDIG domain
MADSDRRYSHPFVANCYVAGHILCGAAIVVWSALHWSCPDPLRFIAYLVSALVGSTLKLRFPSVEGTQSVSFLFVFLAVLDGNLPNAVALGVSAVAVQCLWHAERRPRAVQMAFSLANGATAIWVTGFVYLLLRERVPAPFLLSVMALSYFVANTLAVAGVIALTESVSLAALAKADVWILPYYAGGVSAAWLVTTLPASLHWEVPIISLPLVYVVHRSYGLHVDQLEQAKKHVEEISGVHLRTIEALALAIDAKDHTTHGHLARVQIYAGALAQDLGLNACEQDALRTASVLHDIGKLAVPEQIICKPGKLTRAEFDKMKIHPVVGAEILSRVQFPYPVVPIVRSHHEKWDGSGYPDGLKGEEIPIGARILSVVDCLDALASDRQYRKALPLDEAMAKVAAEAGKSFDPTVVQVMQKRYRELESQAKALAAQERPAISREIPAVSSEIPAISREIRVERGAAPAAGFAAGMDRPDANLAATLDFPVVSTAIELTVEESLAVLAMRLQSAVPCDAIAFFENRDALLFPRFAGGTHGSALGDLRIPLGTGMVGWVAEHNEPIVNGNPLVEPGYTAGPQPNAGLQSALALPVASDDGAAGVWALYRQHPDAFTSSDLFTLAMRLEGKASPRENSRGPGEGCQSARRSPTAACAD